MSATYIESKIDRQKYCKSNGQFTRHLRECNLTYQQYYEQYITKHSPKCSCGRPLTFYQKTETYAKSCGAPLCVGKSVSLTKQSLSEEIKSQHSKNYKIAQSHKTKEQRLSETQKKKKTYFQNFGTTLSNAPEQKEKARTTKLQKYGDEKYNNSKQSSQRNRNKTPDEKNKINDIRRKTNLEKFGVSCPFLKSGVLEKSAKSNASGKDYMMPSGKIVGVRGYEDLVLIELLKVYDEQDIVIHNSYEEYKLPVFSYIDHRRHHLQYYPDIYIPSENKLIEVKSRWWWDGNGTEKYKSRLKNNLTKRQAVLDKGYKYAVWLFEDKKKYTVLSDGPDFQT